MNPPLAHRIIKPYQYTPSNRTNVLETLRKHGFVPTTEKVNDQTRS